MTNIATNGRARVLALIEGYERQLRAGVNPLYVIQDIDTLAQGGPTCSEQRRKEHIAARRYIAQDCEWSLIFERLDRQVKFAKLACKRDIKAGRPF